MSEEMKCKNCKYHYIEELTFDYPQSCCRKRSATTEQWCKCNDFEYGDRYIEQLQQENTQLKKELEITTFNFQSLSSACGSLAEFMGLDKDSIIEEMIDKVVKDRKEKDLYKSVLKEIREYIKEHENESIYLDCKLYETKVYNDLLEIIDKGIGENNGQRL